MTTIDDTTTPADGTAIESHTHDFETVVQMGTGDPTTLWCQGCGRSWPIATPATGEAAPAGEVAGYVVVGDVIAAAGDDGQPKVTRWMSPNRRPTLEDARRDQEFWSSGRHLKHVDLRLAELVIVDRAET
ncbi:hypothetical protein [Nonomuraea sp. NPDC003214]